MSSETALPWDMIVLIRGYWPALNGLTRSCKRLSAPADPADYVIPYEQDLAPWSKAIGSCLPNGLLNGDVKLYINFCNECVITYDRGAVVAIVVDDLHLVVMHNLLMDRRGGWLGMGPNRPPISVRLVGDEELVLHVQGLDTATCARHIVFDEHQQITQTGLDWIASNLRKIAPAEYNASLAQPQQISSKWMLWVPGLMHKLPGFRE